MERETRLELATSSLARKHSTTELLPRNLFILYIYNICSKFYVNIFFCAPVLFILKCNHEIYKGDTLDERFITTTQGKIKL